MCAHAKFSLFDRVFRVPFLDFNDVASAIISSSMERFRLAHCPGGAARAATALDLPRDLEKMVIERTGTK